MAISTAIALTELDLELAHLMVDTAALRRFEDAAAQCDTIASEGSTAAACALIKDWRTTADGSALCTAWVELTFALPANAGKPNEKRTELLAHCETNILPSLHHYQQLAEPAAEGLKDDL